MKYLICLVNGRVIDVVYDVTEAVKYMSEGFIVHQVNS